MQRGAIQHRGDTREEAEEGVASLQPSDTGILCHGNRHKLVHPFQSLKLASLTLLLVSDPSTPEGICVGSPFAEPCVDLPPEAPLPWFAFLDFLESQGM